MQRLMLLIAFEEHAVSLIPLWQTGINCALVLVSKDPVSLPRDACITTALSSVANLKPQAELLGYFTKQ